MTTATTSLTNLHTQIDRLAASPAGPAFLQALGALVRAAGTDAKARIREEGR